MNKQKRVLVFGANGRVGRFLVEYALADGYKVTAFVHRHHGLPDNPNLTIFRGDVYKSDDIANALKSQDAVLSALSSWGSSTKDVLATAMGNIIPAMKQHGISRIISLTGAEARAPGDSLGIIHRFAHVALNIVGGKVLRDGEKHIALLAQSELDWTVVRSSVMTSQPGTSYTLSSSRPRPWALVRRTAVARAMVDQLNETSEHKAAPYISNS